MIQRLRGLRIRLRRFYLLAGCLRLSLEIMAYLICAYALDRLLLLPSTVRLVLLLLASVALLLRVRSLLLYPLRRPIRVEDMALAVERKHRSLQGKLASAVELARVVENPPADVSPSLLEQWLADIESVVNRVEIGAIFKLRRLKQWAMVNVGLLLVIGGFSAAQATEADVFLRRLVGMSAEWPRRTHLSLTIPEDSAHYRVEKDETGRVHRVLIARGASLPVLVHAVGVVPGEVFLNVSESRLGRAEQVRMLPREGEHGLFAYRFRNVVKDLRLQPMGGDDPGTSLTVGIEVQAPPTVDRLVATMTPPPYTGLPTVREERQDFQLPIGTQLGLEIYTAGDTHSGTITFHSDPATAQDLDAHPEDPVQLLYSFPITESGTFNLHLAGASGFRNLVALDYRITAVPDRPPTIELARPGVSNLEVTTRGVVPFQVLVDDDYGLTLVELLVSRFGEERESPLELFRRDGRQEPGSGEPVELQHALDFLTFRMDREGELAAMSEGETLVYAVAAQDNRTEKYGEVAAGQAKTALRRVDLVSDAEKIRKLSDRQLRLKQAVRTLKRTQEEKLAELEAFLGGGSDEVEPADSREMAALEIDEDRISSRARQRTKEFSELVEEYLLNRLDPSPSSERALNFYLKRTQTRLTRRFDPSAYRELVQAHVDGQFGELDFLGNLFEMLSLALQASEVHTKAAVDALRQARLSEESSTVPTLFEAALQAERAVIDTYALLLEKMEEWEDFQEILELWRGLVLDQEDINRRYKTSGSGSEK
jgi:hypothetical protein